MSIPRPNDIVARKYKVLSVLGEGEIAIALVALDLERKERVTLRFLRPEKQADAALAERFVTDARAATKLKDEHSVRALDVAFAEDGAPFTVLEQVTGCDLETVLTRRGRLPVETAVDYVLQACESVAEAHARGIAHGDLRTASLFLTHRPDGSPCIKVLDFAMPLGRGDVRADMRALGAILMVLVVEMPPMLDHVIAKCLEELDGERFKDVGELSRAIAPFGSSYAHGAVHRIARALTGQPPATHDGPLRPAGIKRRHPVVVAIAAMCFFGLLGSAVFVWMLHEMEPAAFRQMMANIPHVSLPALPKLTPEPEPTTTASVATTPEPPKEPVPTPPKRSSKNAMPERHHPRK